MDPETVNKIKSVAQVINFFASSNRVASNQVFQFLGRFWSDDATNAEDSI